MISSRKQIALSAGFLILTGLGLTFFKVTQLDFPLLPGEYREVWTVESKISLEPTGEPVDVRLHLPAGIAGWAIPEEHFASSGFEFSVDELPVGREVRWRTEALETDTTLYYKFQTYRDRPEKLPDMVVKKPRRPRLEKQQKLAMQRVMANLAAEPADVRGFVRALIVELSREDPEPDTVFLLGTYEESRETVILDALAFAGIPAQRIRGLSLEDGRRRQTISPLLEVHDGESWVAFDFETGESGIPANFFVWQRGNGAVLQVAGGRDSSLEFAMVSNNLPVKAILGMEQRSRQYALLDFSIYTLPVEQQGVFKGLLLIPVAALVVVIMRVLVGVRTSGTFMPILIALAFIQTTLLVGLAIFLVLVGVGLWIRSWLSHMNLLLVSRISAVVIVVILLMATLAVTSYKLGLDQILTVTFFPTVILAWTIERMSILSEEEGMHEVLIQGGGSLLVAVLAYLAMSNRLVSHLTFNFPELMLTLLGVILLLGKYKGYRLSELRRFRDMGSAS